MEFDSKEIALWQYRHQEKNEGCVNYGKYSEWENCTSEKAKEIQDYIDHGYSYEVRALVVV